MMSWLMLLESPVVVELERFKMTDKQIGHSDDVTARDVLECQVRNVTPHPRLAYRGGSVCMCECVCARECVCLCVPASPYPSLSLVLLCSFSLVLSEVRFRSTWPGL